MQQLFKQVCAACFFLQLGIYLAAGTFQGNEVGGNAHSCGALNRVLFSLGSREGKVGRLSWQQLREAGIREQGFFFLSPQRIEIGRHDCLRPG